MTIPSTTVNLLTHYINSLVCDMKKIVAFAGFALLSVGAFAQTNLQVFYDFGEYRKNVTTTLEMFKSDDWGSTFFFVDYDYTDKAQRDAKIWGL